MRWSYSCPHCGGVLNRERSIMLVATHGEQRIVIGLHPKPGNYEVSAPPGTAIEEGSVWEFFCPLCRSSLISDVSDTLCRIDMVTAGIRHRVYFSRIAGERATFVISDDGVEPHGEHAHRHSLELLELV